ncbi:MAG: SGNH/GDSL hydrolase family protein [Acidobacteriota bacterium]
MFPRPALSSCRRFATLSAIAALLSASGCGGSSPTTPTPTPPSLALTLACPAFQSVPQTAAAGALVSYPSAVATGGRAPVSISCKPASGQVFAAGTTTVTCTGTDAGAAAASCSFAVLVTAAPILKDTTFLAFGDSITSGEVTVPVTLGAGWSGREPLFKQIVVPSVSYPTVLNTALSRRYITQSISVVNAGRPNDQAAYAYPRFLTAFAAARPEAVLLLMGYNDLDSTSTANAANRAIELMAKEARNRGARVFIATLTPTIPNRLRSEPEAILTYYNNTLRSLAFGEGAELVDLYTAFLPSLNTLIGVDGLHPNEAGYAKIAELFEAAIRSELEAR